MTQTAGNQPGEQPRDNSDGERNGAEETGGPAATESALASAGDALPWRHAIAVFALALALRALYLFELEGEPLVEILTGDSKGYDEWARRIAGGEWLGTDVFYQAPLYPYFMAVVYAIAGAAPVAVRICQIVMGAAGCVFLASAASRLFSTRVGFIAGVIAAVYGPAIYYDGLIQKSSLDFFLLTLVLWMAARGATRSKLASWLVTGVALGALVLTRENALVLAPALLLWIAMQTAWRPKQRALAAALLIAGIVVALAPVALRNRAVGGEFHLTTSQFGPNFYIGNNPSADGRYRSLVPGRGSPEFERTDAENLARAALGRDLSPGEVSRYWTGRSIEFIRAEPAAWMRLIGRKFVLALNAAEIGDTTDLYSHADRSIVLRLASAIFHFGLLAPLALIGVALAWRERKAVLLLGLIALAYLATLLIFYVFGRYRFPLVPVLVIFAARGIDGALELARRNRDASNARPSPARAAAWFASAAALAIFCNWPVLSKDEMRATTQVNIGRELREQGDDSQALDHYRAALQFNPRSTGAHFNTANLLADGGDAQRAIEHYRLAIRYGARDALAYYNLGIALLDAGRPAEAQTELRRALALDPASADTLNNLGIALGSTGRLAEAIEHFRRAIELESGADSAARRNLSAALAVLGKD